MKGAITQNGVTTDATQQGIEQAAAGGTPWSVGPESARPDDAGPGDSAAELVDAILMTI